MIYSYVPRWLLNNQNLTRNNLCINGQAIQLHDSGRIGIIFFGDGVQIIVFRDNIFVRPQLIDILCRQYFFIDFWFLSGCSQIFFGIFIAGILSVFLLRNLQALTCVNLSRRQVIDRFEFRYGHRKPAGYRRKVFTFFNFITTYGRYFFLNFFFTVNPFACRLADATGMSSLLPWISFFFGLNLFKDRMLEIETLYFREME